MVDSTTTTDILVPEREFIAEYTVNNPAKLLGAMSELMKAVWRVSSAAAYTDKIKWDVSGENVDFYGEWRVKDKKDSRTMVWNRIIVQGAQSSKTKDGSVTVRIRPMMTTKIEGLTAIDMAVRAMYVETFYKEQMRQYVEIAKKRINDFDNAIRRELGIEESEARSRPASRM